MRRQSSPARLGPLPGLVLVLLGALIALGALAVAPEQASAVVAGAPTAVLQLTLSGVGRPSWTWSPAGVRWVRAEGSALAAEADGTPLRAVDVVVLRVDVVNTGAVDAAGDPVPETVVVGGGDVLVATGGSPVTLAAGNTWVELVPNRTGAVTLR